MAAIKSLVLIANAIVCFVLLASQVFVSVPFGSPVIDKRVEFGAGILSKLALEPRDAYTYDVYWFNSSSDYISKGVTFIAHGLNWAFGAPMTKVSMKLTPADQTYSLVISDFAVMRARSEDENLMLEAAMNATTVFANYSETIAALATISDFQWAHLPRDSKLYFYTTAYPFYFLPHPAGPGANATVPMFVTAYLEPDEVALFGKSIYFLFAALISFALSASSGIAAGSTSCCSCCLKCKKSAAPAASTEMGPVASSIMASVAKGPTTPRGVVVSRV